MELSKLFTVKTYVFEYNFLYIPSGLQSYAKYVTTSKETEKILEKINEWNRVTKNFKYWITQQQLDNVVETNEV